MTALLPRLTLRLLVPAAAMIALFALGEPLPARADSQIPAIDDSVAVALKAEAAQLKARAEATEKSLAASAAQMRWFVTLPASSRRCISDTCSS